MSARSKWPIGIAALFGVWLFVSPFVVGASGAHLWNDVVVGAVVAILGAYSGYTRAGSRGASGLVTLLGLWSIVTPFVYAGGSGMLWSDVISGIVVAVLAGYDTYAVGASSGAETGTAQSTS